MSSRRNLSLLHPFRTAITGIHLPEAFNNPFDYTPHPLCQIAAEAVQQELERHPEWLREIGLARTAEPDGAGKMFGVLVVQTAAEEIGYLTAFSGLLGGLNRQPGFVPPVFDYLANPDDFRNEEMAISATNDLIRKLENGEE